MTTATTAVSYSVDPWDPSYGMAYGEELGGDRQPESTAELILDLELPEAGRLTRALLRERFGAAKPGGLKALLAAAPLEEVDLTRERDTGRDLDL